MSLFVSIRTGGGPSCFFAVEIHLLNDINNAFHSVKRFIGVFYVNANFDNAAFDLVKWFRLSAYVVGKNLFAPRNPLCRIGNKKQFRVIWISSEGIHVYKCIVSAKG